MYRALTAEQSRQLEHRAVEAGSTLAELMRSAGTAVAREVQQHVPEGDIVVLTGAGNSGGDGWVAAHDLHAAGRCVRVIALRSPEELSGIASDAARDAVAAGVAWRSQNGALYEADLEGAAVVIDALLGTGSVLPLREPIPSWCGAVNSGGWFVVSVDVPTGVDSDTGRRDPHAVRADLTVTFSQPKLGLVTYPAAENAGEVFVADIGVPRRFADDIAAPRVLVAEEYARMLPVPAAAAHKNERGRVLVIAGSASFPGAAVLCARGAMRAGAGYVTLAVPDPVVAIAQAHLLAVPVVGLPSGRTKGFSADAGERALVLAREYDAVVLGPGLTMADGAVAMARQIVARLDRPLVVDADGLNALVDATELIGGRGAPTVLTPHPGELARLLGRDVSDVQADRVSSSSALAGGGSVVVLKGAGTVVSDGTDTVITTAGTPALATAGTGDVLAGIIGSLLAQGVEPFSASALGAHLHGRAGEAAAAELTPMCVTAEDVPGYLPHAFGELLEVW